MYLFKTLTSLINLNLRNNFTLSDILPSAVRMAVCSYMQKYFPVSVCAFDSPLLRLNQYFYVFMNFYCFARISEFCR